MKKHLLWVFLLILTTFSLAQTDRDTVTSFNAGPGVLYTKLVIPSKPCIVHVLEIDRKNPSTRLETVKSNDLLNGSLEAVSSMSLRHNSDGHYVIGAVNGDFFSGNNPLQMQIKNGEILHRERTDGAYASAAFDLNKAIEFTSPAFSGSVTAGSSSLLISGVNESRASDKLVMYNSLYGISTKTTSGTEIALHPIGEWFVNDTVYCVVDSIRSSGGNMAIVKGGIVLSGTGTAAAFLSSMKAGDVVKVYTKATGKLKKIKELVGGHPFFMKNGVISPSIDLNDPMLRDRNPRTLIGINKDTSKIFIVVADGRSASSVGMTVWEMVDFMKSIGVVEAMNFDGGGSTQMVVRNNIVNTPSDGQARAVSNTLMIVSTQTSGNVAKLNISPKKYRLYKGEQIKFSLAPSDVNDNPALITQSLVQFSVKPELGTVDNSGKFVAGNFPGSGYIYAKYNNITDSAFITVKSITSISVSPKTVLTDNNRTVQIIPHGYDMDNIERGISASELSWMSSNISVASVDTNGLVKGKSEGTVKIIASYMSTMIDTVSVTVQIGKGDQVLDPMEALSLWKVTGSNIDTSYTKLSISDEKTEGKGSLRIDYKFTYNTANGNYVYLENDIPVYGIPDSLFIDTKSDSTSHRLSFIFSDDNGELFKVNAFGYINSIGYFNTIPTPLKTFAPLGSGTFYFPVRLKRIEIQLQYNNPKRVAGQSYTGTILLDKLRMKYPTGATSVSESGAAAREYSLKQNYPNPFNPSTVIEFTLAKQEDVSLKVYDLLGREVAVLINGRLSEGVHKAIWNGSDNASGVYFYRLQSGSLIETRKMMLIR